MCVTILSLLHESPKNREVGEGMIRSACGGASIPIEMKKSLCFGPCMVEELVSLEGTGPHFAMHQFSDLNTP